MTLLISHITLALKSSFIREVFIYGLAGVFSKFAPLIVIPIYLKHIGIESFGILDLYITIGTLAFILVEMQVTSGFMRSFYEEREAARLGKLVGNAVALYTFSFVVFICSLIFCSILVAVPISFVDFSLLTPVAIGLIGRCFSDLYLLSLRMEHCPYTYAGFSLLNVIITALSGAYASISFPDRIELILLAISIVQLAFGICSFLALKKIYKFDWDFTYTRALLTYGIPITFASLGGWLLSAAGRVVLADEATLLELGIYSVSLKVALIYVVLLQAFRTAWDPLCMKMFGEKNSKTTFALYLRIYLLSGSLIVLAIYSISGFVYSLLGADITNFSSPLMLALLLGHYWQGVIHIIAVGNAWVRKTYYNALGTLSGGTLGLISTSLLYDAFGVVSGGIGFLFGMLSSCTIIFIIAQYNIKIPYHMKDLLVAFVATIAIVAIFTQTFFE